MDRVVDYKKCTGCTACMNICVKNAITMEENSEGFYYPKIDDKKCINCGLCKKTCPVLNSNNNNIKKCYAAYNDNIASLLNKSSSGGLFELFAKYILSIDGVVIGAELKNNKLEHTIIDNINDLEKIKGAKYFQSNLKYIFKYIKENINTKKILFVGTPCQVAGLKSIINNDNLYCIDLVCHGVPSKQLFNKYINYIEKKYNDKLIDYNFRDKKSGWLNYSNTAIFINKKVTKKYTKNSYSKLFLSNKALRESCYNCKFKIYNSYSDITLGDFWGIEKVLPEMSNKNGVSCVVINTEKGSKLFNKIIKNIRYKECSIKDIIKYNSSIVNSPVRTNDRDNFYNDLKIYPFNRIIKKYTKSLFSKIVFKIKNRINK
ncbi:MAG: Coenzyme F420 hydrogenase/dehydrogenase, beta subunit C-terminal domain [Bacilli bacterium]|nr:Coenzyme F420 hydrogenase/dehydrogenase, beta subunit C-terminal domain [Bacilli bacterium]